MSFSPQHLLATLCELPKPSGYCVALSGGLDSTVLLHALATLRDHLPVSLSALHIDHGIAADSAQWAEHCERLCAELAVPLRRVRVDIGCTRALGLEASARRARYRVFESELTEGQMLLSAHHRDDQAETLLLQLFRGGGVHGLAGMPPLRRLGRGWLARPLLQVGREALQGYAETHSLDWLEDPSNRDTRLERNYIRHQLLPQLNRRRTGIAAVLARSARHFGENAELLDELAAMDLSVCVAGEGLAIPALLGLSAPRQRNVLRYWLRRLGLPLPDHRRLQAVLDDLLPAAADASPLVVWPGAELRRFRETLYAMVPLAPLPPAGWQQRWDGEGEVKLAHGLGRYRLMQRAGGMRRECLQGKDLVLCLREGGERLRLPGQPHHHSLKSLLQQAALPPWQRERLPLVYIDGELAQVAGLWTAAPFAVTAGEVGLVLERLGEG